MNVIVDTDIEFFLEGDNESFDEEKLDDLETVISQLDYAAMGGMEAVPDAIYDRLVEILREHRPGSEVLAQLWDDREIVSDGQEATALEESEEFDVNSGKYAPLLRHYPMMSIETIKNLDDLSEFTDIVPANETLFASFKINGHGVRVVYEDGDLVLATTRARSSKGRDITRQMKNILGPHNEALEGSGTIEIRGEVALPFSNLEKAREFNPAIKSAFSGVSSLIKPSSGEAENSLLSFLAYRMLSPTGISFDTKEEEYTKLQEMGFETPIWSIRENEGDTLESIKSILEVFEKESEDYDYFCDGVVVEVDSRDVFDSLGSEGKYNRGNVALKLGKWEQSLYVGKIRGIDWKRGKKKLSPVAVIESVDDVSEDGQPLGVLTVQGNRVRNVPLYEPRNILILDAYPGNLLYFRYGGEAGVVPCSPLGELLTDDAVRSQFN